MTSGLSKTANRPTKQGSPEPIAALNRVRMEELALPWPEREPLVDLREACPDVVVMERICPYLRQGVAERLNRAQASLPPGHRLRVHTALRTPMMQKRGWDGYFQKMREQHPDWPLSALRRATNKYHAPYDQPAPPGHCTGGAVDINLLGPDGKDLDLIAPTQGWEAAYTWSDKIGPDAKRNRMMMAEAMLGAGFSNCRDEYWHYSWGDSAWAVRVGESVCPYGWTYAAARLETDFTAARAADLSMTTRRDVNGKPTEATGACAIAPDAEQTAEGVWRFSVGLYWAMETPVTLHIALPTGQTGSLPLWAGDGEEIWRPIGENAGEVLERQGDTLLVRLVPDRDRLVLTSILPPPKPETA